MEAKRADESLKEAYDTNLHDASQALHNIHAFMSLAGQETTFFEKVRVFSLACNAEHFSVRVHRGVLGNDHTVEYHFQEYLPKVGFAGNEACLLLNAILKDNAAKECW